AVLAPLAVGAQESLAVGEVLGPLVGAVFSLVAHTVWRRLLEESERNRRLVARLRAAQAELADSERRKGVAEERQRLAQDLHDTLAQGLNSIVLMSRAARTAHPEAGAEFSRIEDAARSNLADARGLERPRRPRPAGRARAGAARRDRPDGAARHHHPLHAAHRRGAVRAAARGGRDRAA